MPNAEDRKKVQELILSGVPANLSLAKQLIKGFGMPPSMTTELFLIGCFEGTTRKSPLANTFAKWGIDLKEKAKYQDLNGFLVYGGQNYFSQKYYWEHERRRLGVMLAGLLRKNYLDRALVIKAIKLRLSHDRFTFAIKGFLFEIASPEEQQAYIDDWREKATLDLGGFGLKAIPPIVFQQKGIIKLSLAVNQFKELPEELFEMKSISTLDLRNNGLKELPKEIKKLGSLQLLNLSNNLLSELPDIFGSLPNLKSIDLSNNQLKSLPPSFKKLKKLHSLYLRGSGFRHLPKIFAHLPLIRNINGIAGYDRAKTAPLLKQFLQRLHPKNVRISDKDKEALIDIFSNNDEAVKGKINLHKLFEYADFPNEIVAAHALGYIRNWKGLALENSPLGKGSRLSLMGDIDLKLKQGKWQKKLKELEVEFSPTASKEATHIVLGQYPKGYKKLDKDGDYTFITEQELKQVLTNTDSLYLMEKGEEGSQNRQNIAQLLASTDESNVGLAIELLEGGGVARGILTELFFAAKTVSDKKIREKAKKVLLKYASKEVAAALKDRSKLIVAGYDAEKKLYKKLHNYARITGEINWSKIGYYLYLKCGNGLRYTFDKEPQESELRRQIIQELINGNKLDFHKAYAQRIPSYSESYAYPYYESTEFPIEILNHPEITELDCSGCRISAIPHNITKLQNLRKLNLNGNFLKSLPEELKELKHLEEIDISDNEFSSFPLILAQIQSLKKIKIKANRKKWEASPIDTPDVVKELLPKCKFKDGS